ncbi:hypothetical protein JXA88_09490 [Candidatus Fermentibacteria bacterium]|nr:hypothetical protein [Candidatus Fermentibacteria bacterium]
MPEPDYRREFKNSPHHLWLAILTVGVGVLSAEVLGLILGVTGYALGWIYLPDMPFFKRWVHRRREKEERRKALQEMILFVRRRDAELARLTNAGRTRYNELAAVCREIDQAGADGDDRSDGPRVRKLEELMWTYLRLLRMQESLEVFLEGERKEDLPRMVRESEEEVQRLAADIEADTSTGSPQSLESRQRLHSSRSDRLSVLHKRMARLQEAKENLALVASEQDRLHQQIKLIRADAMAMRNTEALTARIDASVEQLDQTNRWLAQMAEFKDVVGDLPPPDMRIGFGEAATPERERRGRVKQRA